jgi:hypothetical protein
MPAARTEVASQATCRNCGQALAEGLAVCSACGAANGEANRCPHCDAVADVEPHSTLGFRCLVCGGPRIALDVANVTPSPRTRAALTAAGREQTKHVMFSAVGFLLSGMGALSLVIATLVLLTASPGLVVTLATYLAALVPVAAGLLALSRAGFARKLRAEALRSAQISALGDVQAVTGPLDAARVAQLMRLSPERAELLLAEASIAALLNEGPAPKLRVEAPPTSSTTVLGDAAELAEAAAQPDRAPLRAARGDTES